MKILVGFGTHRTPEESQCHAALNKLGDEIKIFSTAGGDVLYTLSMSIEEILRQLPDFHPDVILLSSIESWPIPKDLEKFDGLVIATIGDWNLNTLGILASQYAIDYNFTDKLGIQMLHKWGAQADYYPMFFLAPKLFSPMTNIERIYDVSFLGNFHQSIQAERNLWLYRLSKLKKKYNIRIGSAYGKEYTLTLNQSKIIFNRTIRQEANMRCFETLAYGALLFVEDDNLEIRDFFQDRIHCVLYNEHNLEELLDYYLSHEQERMEIAMNGYHCFQKMAEKDKVTDLLKKIHQFPLKKKIRKPLFQVKEPYHYLLKSYPQIEYNESYSGEEQDPIVYFNLGVTFFREKQYEKALTWFQKCQHFLESIGTVQTDYLPFLSTFSDFALQWSVTYREGETLLRKRQAQVLYQEVCHYLGLILSNLGEIKNGIELCEKGLSRYSKHFNLLYLLGVLYEVDKQFQKAYDCYHKAFALKPMFLPLWEKLLSLLCSLDLAQAEEFMDTHLEMLSAFPPGQVDSVRNNLISIFSHAGTPT